MKIVWTVLATLGALVVIALIWLYSGVYNVAASVPHTAATEWALSTLMDRSVAAHVGDVQVPALDDSALVIVGAGEYREMCATCHGAPGVERSATGKGLNPEPPDLAKSAPEWSDAEIHWIISHGIKMAGMPGFGKTHDEHKLWGMTAFVRQLPHMTAADYQMLTAAAGGDEGDDDHDHLP